MRVLVCGGRYLNDRKLVFKTLDRFHQRTPISCIIEGGASGADLLAAQWAEANGVRHSRYNANWTAFGRRAGPLRNQSMLDEGKPDLVVAFPGGRGTADMVARAGAAGVLVWKEDREDA